MICQPGEWEEAVPAASKTPQKHVVFSSSKRLANSTSRMTTEFGPTEIKTENDAPFSASQTAARIPAPTDIRQLSSDPSNRRRHPPRNIAMLRRAMSSVGIARAVVTDETNTVLAGNATVQAAASLGFRRLHVVDVDGETLVAVRRIGLTEEQKRELAMFDNRTAELAEWDTEQLVADARAGLSLAEFFQPVELADLLGADAPTPTFSPVSATEQGRLDEMAQTVCPKCGHAFDR